MAFPVLCPLPSMPSSSRASQYPPPPPVGIKLTQKKRWSVKRVLLILLTAVAGYDFCNEFALGAGSKGPAVQIAPTNSKTKQGDSSGPTWRERSLALLRLKSTRKAPPAPPQEVKSATATASPVTVTSTTTTSGSSSSRSSTAAIATAASTPSAVAASTTTATTVRPSPSRTVPAPVAAVPLVREVALLPSARRSSVSASQYWRVSNDGNNTRTLTPSVYRNDNTAEWEERSEQEEYDEKEASINTYANSTSAAGSGGSYPYLATGLSSPPFVQSSRPWQSPEGFTQLVEA